MSGERLYPPNDPVAFESLCLDLWRDVWNDPGAQKNGRSGQPQAGVDVYGRTAAGWVGVQCKQKDSLVRSKLTVRELEDEVRKARTFEPPLHRFLVATTGPRDALIQERARKLSEPGFAVEVWSWEDLWHEISGRPALFARLFTVYWPLQAGVRARPSAAPTGPTAPRRPSAALATWQEKLAYLEEQEAITVDPDAKFRVRKLIAEAREKIREHGGEA